jgi:hypothetical protein
MSQALKPIFGANVDAYLRAKDSSRDDDNRVS